MFCLLRTLASTMTLYCKYFAQLFTFSCYLANAIVCIIKSFICHNIIQAMSYHIMELHVMTISASLLHTMCLCVVTDIDDLQLKQNLPNSHWIAMATYSHAYSQRYNSGSSSHFFCATPVTD